MNVLYRPRAGHDLLKIVAYSKRTQGGDAWRAYMADVRHAARIIAEFPESSPACDGIAPGLRRKLARDHAIYYFIRPTHIDIVRVLHQMNDPTIHLGGT